MTPNYRALIPSLIFEGIRKIIVWPFIVLRTEIPLVKGLPFLPPILSTPFFMASSGHSVFEVTFFIIGHLLSIVAGILWIHEDVKSNNEQLNPWRNASGSYFTFGLLSKKPLSRLPKNFTRVRGDNFDTYLN